MSAALQEAYASADTEIEVIDTIELRSDNSSIYLCKGFIQRTLTIAPATTAVFEPFPYNVSSGLGLNTSGSSTVTVKVENVNGSVMSWLNSAKQSNTPVYLIFRTWLSNQTLPQNTRPLKLTLESAKANVSGVTFSARVSNAVNKAFPNARYTYTAFPGLRG